MAYSDNYDRIVEAYLNFEGAKVSAARLFEIQNIAKRMCEVSKTHHYITQYFIKGFAGDDKQLYVYDKVLDKIKRKKSPSSGIFHIENLNTLDFDKGLQASFIEDDYFKIIDNSLCKALQNLRTKPIAENFLTPEMHGQISIFIADIFWRNPISNITFDSLFNNPEIFAKVKNYMLPNSDLDNESLKDDPSFKKLFRSGMGLLTIKEILAERSEGNLQSRLKNFDDEQFVIGDYPILWKKQPETILDLFDTPYYLPVSTKRVYLSNINRDKVIDKIKAYMINVLIINQSQFLICSANLKVLEKSIEIYKKIKERGHFNYLYEALFDCRDVYTFS